MYLPTYCWESRYPPPIKFATTYTLPPNAVLAVGLWISRYPRVPFPTKHAFSPCVHTLLPNAVLQCHAEDCHIPAKRL